MSLRNLLLSIFSRAQEWETFIAANPAKHVHVGRRRTVREKRKLTVEQTIQLLQELRDDVRTICMVALSCGLRISEVLGLTWAHVDFTREVLLIRQRCWRGDVAGTKSEDGVRDIPYGALGSLLRKLFPGPHALDQFCFSVETRPGFDGTTRATRIFQTRDDRTIRRYWLRPTAKKLGIYYPGFGFHSLRREAVTFAAKQAGAMQASRFAGHSGTQVTMAYILRDQTEYEKVVRGLQEPLKKAGLL